MFDNLHWTFWPTVLVVGLLFGWIGGTITAMLRTAKEHGWRKTWRAFVAVKGWRLW